MSEFIRVTSGNYTKIIRKNDIDHVSCCGEECVLHMKPHSLVSRWAVKETPEEIMALIEGKAETPAPALGTILWSDFKQGEREPQRHVYTLFWFPDSARAVIGYFGGFVDGDVYVNSDDYDVRGLASLWAQIEVP